jgi:acyl-CoA synthetase (AMP-forming)/AMP-acid ligase II
VKVLGDSGARVLICQDDLYRDVAMGALPSSAVRHTITTSPLDFLADDTAPPPMLAGLGRTAHEDVTDLLALIVQHAGQSPDAIEIDGHDVAFMVYTSGTTGEPKAALNTHRNVVFATTVYERWIGLTSRASLSRHRSGRPRHALAADRQPAGALLPLRCRRSLPAHAGAPGHVHGVVGHGVHRTAQP